MNYMGIDHHRQYSHITLLDEKGEKLNFGRVSNLRSELENFLSGIEEVKAVVEIADIGRFADERKLHSYAGVIPSTYSSGGRTYHGKIIKEGNRWLRWAVVEAVWPAIRADFDVRCYYERLKRKKGANSAKVATARRLLTIIYRMLKENRSYIPYKR